MCYVQQNLFTELASECTTRKIELIISQWLPQLLPGRSDVFATKVVYIMHMHVHEMARKVGKIEEHKYIVILQRYQKSLVWSQLFLTLRVQ